MSMNTYPFKETGAFLVDEEVAAYIILAADRACKMVPAEIEALLNSGEFAALAKDGKLPCDYSDTSTALDSFRDLGGEMCFCSEFEGEAHSIFDDELDSERSWSTDILCYMPAAREPELFRAVYLDPRELIDEHKNAFDDAGVVLPEDFNWKSHIVYIEGTYCC